MTWTIEGIVEVGTTEFEESVLRKWDAAEFNPQANARKSKYIHFQIDRVFKKGKSLKLNQQQSTYAHRSSIMKD